MLMLLVLGVQFATSSKVRLAYQDSVRRPNTRFVRHLGSLFHSMDPLLKYPHIKRGSVRKSLDPRFL